MEAKKPERRRIGAILIEEGSITQIQLDCALDLQKAMGKPVGEILISQGFITPLQLASALGGQLKIPYIPLLKYAHNADVSKWVEKDFCLKHMLVPFDGDSKVFYVSMANPLDQSPIETLRNGLKKRAYTFIAPPEEIQKMIERVYS